MAETPEPRLPLAISMGEPAGIGTELLFRAYQHFASLPTDKVPTFFLIDDPFRVEKFARTIGMEISITTLTDPKDAPAYFSEGLPVLPLENADLDALQNVTPGQPSPSTADAVTHSIERAVRCIEEGQASGLVTLPIQKEVLQNAGFAHPGHTEYLGQLTGQMAMPDGLLHKPVMMLTAGPFRVVPATVHTALSQVPEKLTPQHLLDVALVLFQSLVRDYGIAQPRVAVAGLNPHAGEGGHLGKEDLEVIAPVIAHLRNNNADAIGPLPADTMFHEEARAQYHAALAMYHDQALIPIKTIAFYAAVNVTLGLPIVRTSPDHGTALNLVGKGVARPDSLINAIYAADRMALARTQYDRLASDSRAQ